MNEKTRTGLMALAISVGLLVAVGAIAAVLTGWKPSSMSAVGASSASGFPVEDDVRLEKIAGHVWWKKKPTRKQIEQIIHEVTELRAGEVICFDSHGQLTPDDVADKDHVTVGTGSRRNTRFTRHEAIQVILGVLDRADFYRDLR